MKTLLVTIFELISVAGYGMLEKHKILTTLESWLICSIIYLIGTALILMK
jgi:hypothetical protein